MSNKVNTTTLKPDGKHALTPKLRFPEFRDAAGWEEKRLGNEGELLSSLTGKAGADFDAGEARFVTYMNVFANTFVDPRALRFVDVKEGENQNAVTSGDVFFTISSETPDEAGMSSVLLEDLESCYLNSFCALFRFFEGKRPDPVFTGYLLRQPLVRRYFTKKAQGSTRFNLSKDAFRNLPLFVPTPLEQQKIAECLSSVDELIAAQARKLDALKTHKKGLMQQLFPREGETQPRLRFPEFQNAEEWEEKLLGDVVKSFKTGKLDANAMVGNGQYRFYTCAKNYYQIDNYAFEGEALLVAGNGAHLGYIHHYIGKFNAYQRTYVLQKFEANVVFLRCLLERYLPSRILLEKKDGNTPYIVLSTLTEMPLLVPQDTDEQQRIADCLTSLDDLISAQTQKLDALKTHKKGLMQQLFPSPQEVEA
jgi:type I restriction enzyme S subunit